MKVQNMESNKGNTIANQFIITEEGRGGLGNFIKRETFQSYNSVIAIVTTWKPEDCVGFRTNSVEVELDETYWNYSRTTSKYRSIFLSESTEDTKKRIASGEYKLFNLNK